MVITPEMCLAGRDLTEPRPSPTGDAVAVVARWGGEAAIVLVPLTGGPERLLTTAPAPAPGRGLGGGCTAWLPDGSAIVYAAADGGIWCQPVGSGTPWRVAHHGDDAPARAPAVAPDGSHVAYVVDEAQVWWAPLDGDGLPARLDDGAADFCLDPHVTVVPADAGTPASGGWTVRWQAWSVPDMPWDAARVEIAHIATAGAVVARDVRTGAGAIQQPRALPDGRPLEVRDDTGWLNVWLDDQPLVDESFEHAGPTWGPGQCSFAADPGARRVAFTRNEAGFGRLCVVDVASRAVTEVGRGVHGQLGWAGSTLVALRTGARTPTQVVAYDLAEPPGDADATTRRVLSVGPVLAWDHLDPDELPEPEPITVAVGHDHVHARRYRAGRGRMICWIHGGPTDQWQVTFMPRVAYWVARGWDVVTPDPRGSTGHGRAYQQALRGEWGRLDVDDTAAVIRHAHDRGWADPSTTVVMGGSSGGLTALGILGRHPGLAAGGVVLYPVCDVADLAARSHRFEAHYPLSLVGPLDDTERYRERSPLTYADRIDVPLLVLHGVEDPVVPVDQSRALVERIGAAGGAVDLHEIDGEGHGFRDPRNRRREYELVGEHLARVVPDRDPPRPQ